MKHECNKCGSVFMSLAELIRHMSLGCGEVKR